jgi:hypothetical protein
MKDTDLRGGWQNSLADRLKIHSHSYGLRRIGQNVQPDAVKIWIGHTVSEALSSIL